MLTIENFWISIKQQDFNGKELWLWCVYHSMTEDPILYSKLYSEKLEAIRLAEKFSEQTGIRFARPVKEIKKFSLIKGGKYGGDDIPEY